VPTPRDYVTQGTEAYVLQRAGLVEVDLDVDTVEGTPRLWRCFKSDAAHLWNKIEPLLITLVNREACDRSGFLSRGSEYGRTLVALENMGLGYEGRNKLLDAIRRSQEAVLNELNNVRERGQS
jgi:hypothetical protein